MIQIELVKPEEVDQLANLSSKTFYDTFHMHNTKEDMEMFIDKTFNRNTLFSEVSDPNNFFFFARIEDEVAGYLKLSIGERPAELAEFSVLEIARIYATKERLGAGVGKALIEFSISFALKQQKDVVYLGVWEHNERAINFYKRFGFEKFGEHLFMVGNDPQTDWLMKKQLVQN